MKTAIFPDKDFNTEFLSKVFYKSDEVPINNSKHLDEAIREYDAITAKKKEFSKLGNKLIEDVQEREQAALDTLSDAAEAILKKINAYCSKNSVGLNFEPKDDGTSQAELKLEHSTVLFTKTEKQSIKIIPNKEEKRSAA